MKDLIFAAGFFYFAAMEFGREAMMFKAALLARILLLGGILLGATACTIDQAETNRNASNPSPLPHHVDTSFIE